MTCRLSTGRADPPTASRSSPSIEPGHRAGFCRFRSFPMAEFFTHFSCLRDVGTPDNAACGLELSLAFAEEVERGGIAAVGFVLSILPDHGCTHLWMRHDVTAAPAHGLTCVTRYAAASPLPGPRDCEWADTRHAARP